MRCRVGTPRARQVGNHVGCLTSGVDSAVQNRSGNHKSNPIEASRILLDCVIPGVTTSIFRDGAYVGEL
jgi:hypothetical protein